MQVGTDFTFQTCKLRPYFRQSIYWLPLGSNMRCLPLLAAIKRAKLNNFDVDGWALSDESDGHLISNHATSERRVRADGWERTSWFQRRGMSVGFAFLRDSWSSLSGCVGLGYYWQGCRCNWTFHSEIWDLDWLWSKIPEWLGHRDLFI